VSLLESLKASYIWNILYSLQNNTFVPLNSSIIQRYDAKKGFLLTSTNNASALVGKFVCSATLKNETEIVEITVVPPTGTYLNHVSNSVKKVIFTQPERSLKRNFYRFHRLSQQKSSHV
jgi:hypothetical protein